jgi:outer membrane protein assembly factor BamB
MGYETRRLRARGQRGRLAAGAALLSVALALAACGTVERISPQAAREPIPRDGGGPGWLAPNGDLSNTRWVSGPIDAASVSRLAIAWTVPLAGDVGSSLVSHGVVYTQDLNSWVLAIDARSGKVRWRHEYGPRDGSVNGGPNGIALGDGRVYGATTTKLFALDARTGRQLWMVRIVRRRGEGIGMAPLYANGVVYISTNPAGSGYAGGAHGVIWAVDAATGRTRWTWDTVPADLWGRPGLNAGGGLWYPPALDGGMLYAGTGNPGPMPGIRGFPWGSSRPGPNRWTDALVKLDARTGRFQWGRQVLPHDLYDWDLECSPILARSGGRRIVIAGGKMGFVYAFDRDDGALLWKRSVGLHNGHDGDSRLAMRGRGARIRSGVPVLPGNLGGIETPMAADRNTVYVPVNDLYSIFSPYAIANVQQLEAGTGEIVALDLATGRVRWDRKLPSSVYGAATVSNDIVFTTTYDGSVWALRTDSGAVAWRGRLPSPTVSPVTIAGDVLITAASHPIYRGQPLELVAYRLRG